MTGISCPLTLSKMDLEWFIRWFEQGNNEIWPARVQTFSKTIWNDMKPSMDNQSRLWLMTVTYRWSPQGKKTSETTGTMTTLRVTWWGSWATNLGPSRLAAWLGNEKRFSCYFCVIDVAKIFCWSCHFARFGSFNCKNMFFSVFEPQTIGIWRILSILSCNKKNVRSTTIVYTRSTPSWDGSSWTVPGATILWFQDELSPHLWALLFS